MTGGVKLVSRDDAAADRTALERWEAEGGRPLPPSPRPQREGRA